MLTERTIRDAKGDGKARTIWDSQVKGLGLQITQGGKKNYVVRYRADGRKRQAILARSSELSLRDARERAGRELAAIRAGETDPLRRREDAAREPTVAEGLDKFFDEYVPERIRIGRMTPRTAADYRAQADRTLRPALGKLRITDVARVDIERAVAPRGRVQRNRTLALASRLFRLFETWGWRPQNDNPVRGIERSREEPRDRVLAPSEMAALAHALGADDDRHPAPVAAIRFAALTGLRIGEVRGMEWQHVSFETARVTLPTTKTGRRVHDLPDDALAVLRSLPRINAWCFTTGHEAPVAYGGVRDALLRAARAAGLEDVRLHDLRRGYMTAAAAAGVGTHVLRDLLGHKTTAMADRYVRAVGNPVRDARRQVTAGIAASMSGEAGQVIPLERRNTK